MHWQQPVRFFPPGACPEIRGSGADALVGSTVRIQIDPIVNRRRRARPTILGTPGISGTPSAGRGSPPRPGLRWGGYFLTTRGSANWAVRNARVRQVQAGQAMQGFARSIWQVQLAPRGRFI